MSALIEQLQINSPVVRAMLGLLPHLTPPVVLKPGPSAAFPRGCLHLPAMRLVMAGAGGPLDPALTAAHRLARAMGEDVLLVSLRTPHHATRAIRYDVIFTEKDRVELVEDLLFWTLPFRLPAFVPVLPDSPAVVIGRTTLVPSETMPFANVAERAAGVARGTAELRLALWGDARRAPDRRP